VSMEQGKGPTLLLGSISIRNTTNYIVTGSGAYNENERHVVSVTCLPDTVRPWEEKK
jgi:hypothetical protein